MAFLGQEEQIKEFQNRFKYVYFFLFIGFGVLLLRLIYLQIIRGDQMRQFSEENRIKKVKIRAPRGMLFDRNRTLLIDNRPDFDLEVIPQYLKESKKEKMVLGKLSQLLKIPEKTLQKELQKAKNQPLFIPIKIKTNLSWQEVALLEAHKIDMPGVEVRQEIRRTHVFGDQMAHLLGYIGEVTAQELPLLNKHEKRYRLGDQIGRFGLEQKMEDLLRGEDGEEIREVDALGRVKLEKNRNQILQKNLGKEVMPGKNLILSIDQDLQAVATQAFGNHIGAVVALQPQTGEVLVMLSRPSFDPTSFSRGISGALWNQLLTNENHPLRDKTLQDHYAPGSVFKVITAMTGLGEKVIDENTTFHCPGKIKIGNRLFHCHAKHGHGDIQLVRAIAQSCDVYFYRMAQKLKSVDEIAKWASLFGLGKRTGIPLAREVAGLIPRESWKKQKYGQDWTPGETASVAIGQSFLLVTAIQLANLYNTLANGGTLYRPLIVKRIETAEGNLIEEFQPEVMARVSYPPKQGELIQQGLFQALNAPYGTAYRHRLPGVSLAGKTGTVQVIRLSADKIYQRCENMRFQDRHNATFAGFAPFENPKITVVVIAEHACRSGEAARIAKSVVLAYLKKYDPAAFQKANPGALKMNPPPPSTLSEGTDSEDETHDEGYIAPPPIADDSLQPPTLGDSHGHP